MEDLMIAYIKANNNPLTARSLLRNMVDLSFSKAIKEKYRIVTFDSPEGYQSARILEDKGYTAEWKGFAGTRGETRVYLDKRENVGNFTDKLKQLELTDDYTVINVRG